MPDPISAYFTFKTIWSESKPIRDWLWAKLPSVQDSRKREAAETALAKFLDDANALAKTIDPTDLNSKLDSRLVIFREDLQKAKVSPPDIDALSERAGMFARMLIVGPMGDINSIRRRQSDAEEDINRLQRTVESLELRLKHAEQVAVGAQEGLEHQRRQQTAGFVGLVVLLIALVVYYALFR